MKKILVGTLLIFVGILSSQAQGLDDEISLVQASFGMDKKELVEAYMDLPEAVAPGFWTIYERYEMDRKEISRERIKIINEYLEKFDNLSEDEVDNLAKSTLKNDIALSNLHKKYYTKFKKVTSAHDAAKFMQVDTYIHNTIRNAMQQELPFIDEK